MTLLSFLIRIASALGVMVVMIIVLHLTGKSEYDRLIRVLTRWGAVLFFLGSYMQSAWELFRARRSDSIDLTIIWKIMGVILLLAATILIVVTRL